MMNMKTAKSEKSKTAGSGVCARKAKRHEPSRAAVVLMRDFRRIARNLRPGDRHTQNDLAQEMALAVLLCKQPQTLAYFRCLGGWRARDYLRRYGDLAQEPLEEDERLADDPEEDKLDRRVLRALGLEE